VRTAAARKGGDFESRAKADDHADLRLWLRMMAAHKQITNEARRRLRLGFGMSLARFDLMAQLEREPAGVRMGELSTRLMVTTGNITGLMDELEADGLAIRAADPTHRRALLARLTPKGRRLFQTAARANEGWIVEFFAGLSASDKQTLFALLGAQKTHMAALLAGRALS
jgi:DNA-binding MarR family transcriptional regulator